VRSAAWPEAGPGPGEATPAEPAGAPRGGSAENDDVGGEGESESGVAASADAPEKARVAAASSAARPPLARRAGCGAAAAAGGAATATAAARKVDEASSAASAAGGAAAPSPRAAMMAHDAHAWDGTRLGRGGRHAQAVVQGAEGAARGENS
jgi:hypothetical protein